MRFSELLRLVWLNIGQNKFKSIMTSIGIVVGAATIVMVMAIGKGGQMDVAEQFASLNAGAIDISYEYKDEEDSGSGGFGFGNIGSMIGNFFSGGMSGGGPSSGASDGGGSRSSGENSDSSSSRSAKGSTGTSGNASGGSTSGNGDMTMPGGGSGGAFGNSGTTRPGGSSGDSSGDGTTRPGGSSGDSAGSGMTRSGEDNSSDSTGAGMTVPDGSDFQDNRTSGEDGQDENALGESTEGNGSSDQNHETESESSVVDSRMNQEKIVLTADDVSDIETYVSGITGATISYTTRSSVEGGELTDAQTYTIAGVKENYASLSNLGLDAGTFFSQNEDESSAKVCVLGSAAAKEIFGNAQDAVGSQVYIDDRSYTVEGVLSSNGTVASGISPDTSILIPYQTGVKYITGEDISPVLTVIAENVDVLSQVIADVKTVLAENYPNAEFTFSDAGSKMEAAQSSNKILTTLLSAMAVIVFIVGGIGIMNVLFVSVKERTEEIGILKALGASQGCILLEFLIESAFISLMGGALGVLASFAIAPVVTHYGIRSVITVYAVAYALGFAVLTGTLFGLYPAWKASRLEPVDALNQE